LGKCAFGILRIDGIKSSFKRLHKPSQSVRWGAQSPCHTWLRTVEFHIRLSSEKISKWLVVGGLTQAQVVATQGQDLLAPPVK
jgi:hypothetical protein